MLLVVAFYGANTGLIATSSMARGFVTAIMVLYAGLMIVSAAIMRAAYTLLRDRASCEDGIAIQLTIDKIKDIMKACPPTSWYVGVGVTKGLITATVLVLTGYMWAAILWIIFAEMINWEYYFRVHTVLHTIDTEEAVTDHE
jgi:hypothetical protein